MSGGGANSLKLSQFRRVALTNLLNGPTVALTKVLTVFPTTQFVPGPHGVGVYGVGGGWNPCDKNTDFL